MKVSEVNLMIARWSYRRSLKKAQRGLRRVADHLYDARRSLPEREDDINYTLDDIVYPCIRDLEKMRVEEL